LHSFIVAIACSAASLESYFPIIFIPAFISVITEHVWVVLSRPTKYVPAVNAKAGETNAPITATASMYFLILVSLGSNLLPTTAERGAPAPLDAAKDFSPDLRGIQTDLPTAQLSKVGGQPFSEAGASTRSAKDAEIYRTVSPSVVLILTKDGLGSGSLIDKSGYVITNYHVVKGYSNVAVVFKPATEGMEPTRDDMVRGEVTKDDEIADLALVKVAQVPSGRNPLRLGDTEEISVGADVHAIGHPTGQEWTCTTGVISQYRIGAEWTIENVKHKADVIQTQTPINPGNSGGPLISDSSTLIGVNTFFQRDAQGLNFAIAIDEVKKFLTRSGNKSAEEGIAAQNKNACEPKQVGSWRNKESGASIYGYDTNCSGQHNADLIVPDKQSDPIMLRVDRNGDGRADVIFFDFQRRGKWDLSLWSENYDGHWTLVGYHDDGSLTPSRFESYEAFQERQQAQR
jgi:S1-C subfamily serine protease